MKNHSIIEDLVFALASMSERNYPYMAGHQHRVACIAVEISKEMELDEKTINGIWVASLVHDLGKGACPKEILTKPGKLLFNEYKLLQEHVMIGYNILKDIDFPWPIADIVLQHHEDETGRTGYPNRLDWHEILPEAKILRVADTVEAMSSNRPYRPALGIDAALKEIGFNSGKMYNHRVVQACLAVYEKKMLDK